MAALKRQNLPISAKLKIIKTLECGEKKSNVAAAYSVLRSTLSTILKNKADIRAQADKRPDATSARRVRMGAYKDVEGGHVRVVSRYEGHKRSTFLFP